MVTRLFGTLTAPIRGLHQAAYLLAALTFASQLLALLRDRIFAGAFGAGETLDLYYAAFKIPDLVFALVASLVSAYVLIPRIAGAQREETKKLLSQAASFLFIGGGIICAVLAWLMPQMLLVLFPNFVDSPRADEFVLLARLLLMQPILLGLSGVLASVTQVNRRFLLFALSPILYNVGIIVGALFLYPSMGLSGIGIGVILGSVAHLLINIPVVVGAGVFPFFVVPSPKILMSVIKQSVPRSLALSMGAATLFLLTMLAAVTGAGGIAVFALAGNLAAVPLSLIAASYATAAFPVLAKEMNEGRLEAFAATLAAAARHLIFWSAILAILTIVMRAHIVRVVLGTGAFDWDDTRLTAAVLGILAFALVPQGLVLLAARAFYAAGRSWMPFVIQILGLLASVGGAAGTLALARTYPFARDFIEALMRVEGVQGSDILFIAFGAMLGYILMGIVALVTLRTVAPGVAGSLVRPIMEGTGAAIVGGTVAYWTLALMGNIAPLSTLASVLAQGLTAGIVGVVAAAGVLFLLENKEFKDICTSLKRFALPKTPIYDPAFNDRTDS
ncbi:MAG: lipid II flippase MurJ [Patescibacteria group bacterium]